MSDSTDLPASAEVPAYWTDPGSFEPYTSTEYESLNDLLHGDDANVYALRAAAGTLLIGLSTVAESPGGGHLQRLAARNLRMARRSFLSLVKIEDPV